MASPAAADKFTCATGLLPTAATLVAESFAELSVEFPSCARTAQAIAIISNAPKIGLLIAMTLPSSQRPHGAPACFR
jgi:hypothetical protein